MNSIKKEVGIQPAVRDQLILRDKAYSGDIVWVCDPSTTTREPTEAAWTRNVDVTLETAAGEVHTWFNDAITSGVSVGDTSNAGTATIVPESTLTIVDGRARIVVTGSAAAWLGGTSQVETITCTKGTGVAQVESITCTGAPSGDGTITIGVTAAGMTGSPNETEVELVALTHTSVTLVADAVVEALNADAIFAAFFTASNTAGQVDITALTPAANDATMALAFTDTDTTGATFGATADTTAGVAPSAGNITMTVTAAGVTGSPAIVVAVGATDYTPAAIATKLRAAMNLNAALTAFYTVGGTDAAVSLTAITPAANDATLSMGYADTDTTGVTFGASTNTTAGVAKETNTVTIAEATILGYTVTAATSVETISE